ncbi:MAG: ATP-binding cassette domain-containing protein [Solirubrobacteraceae bacterium]
MSPGAPAPLPLVTRGLGRSYGRLVALDELSLTVAGGECVALIGVNGSGKSTAVRMIAGLLPALVVFGSVAVCAVVLAPTGQLAGDELPAALALVCGAPAVVGCAGMSARRGGRLPPEVLVSAVTSDPSGGGLTLLGWLLFWPAVASAIVYVPVRAITVGSLAGHAVVSAGIGLVAVVVMASLQLREPAP